MTDSNDPWSSLADELGVDETVGKPAEEKPAARGRRRKTVGEGEEPSRGRRRAPKTAPADDSESTPPDFLLAEPGVVESDPPSVEGTDGDDGPKKKRRRRSRRKKAGEAGEAGAEMTATAEGGADAEEEADLTPIEDYATWKLPSWQELIDGLHKPG